MVLAHVRWPRLPRLPAHARVRTQFVARYLMNARSLPPAARAAHALMCWMLQFGLPCLFAIYLVSMPRWETGLCWALVVLAVGLSGAGVVSSMQQLVAAARGSGG